ncbi:hypothetical protein U0070_027633 [Myodes glareolus]|uniref:Uncharacterized protein n=1 Tax=Myodes glareolus TaxID=447135 RepID=A0AAW0HS31_MYOGA
MSREEWRSCGVVIYGRILLDPTTITKNPFHFHFVWSQKIRSVITKTPGYVGEICQVLPAFLVPVLIHLPPSFLDKKWIMEPYKICYVYGFVMLVLVVLCIATVCVTPRCTFFLLKQRILGGNGKVFFLLHLLKSMFTHIPRTIIFFKTKIFTHFKPGDGGNVVRRLLGYHFYTLPARAVLDPLREAHWAGKGKLGGDNRIRRPDKHSSKVMTPVGKTRRSEYDLRVVLPPLKSEEEEG